MSRSVYLTIAEYHRLNWACIPLTKAWGGYPYLVGSATKQADYKDVDLRQIISDAMYRRWFGTVNYNTWFRSPRLLVINVAISSMLAEQTGLPIDYQIQSMSQANVPEHDSVRHPMGMVR